MIFVFAMATFFLFSCNQPSENTTETKDSLLEVHESFSEETPENTAVDYQTAIIGKWEYEETQMTIGDQTTNIKAMYHWSLEFKTDGNFHEENQFAEGDEITTLDNTYTIKDNFLQRTGAIEVTIIELTKDQLVIESLSAKMVFNRVK
jgi:hypothetical protein